jgi:hypothetical protein
MLDLLIGVSVRLPDDCREESAKQMIPYPDSYRDARAK